MLHLSEGDIKQLLIKEGFRKTIKLDELVKLLAKMIEYNDYVLTKLPTEAQIKALRPKQTFRCFVPKTVGEEEFRDMLKWNRVVVVDVRDNIAAENIGREIISEMKAKGYDSMINILTFDYNEQQVFKAFDKTNITK